MDKILTKIKVRFQDIDALGHVNSTKIISYLEEGRIDLFKTIKGSYNLEDFDFVIRRIEGDFLEEIFLGDEVLVTTQILKVGKTSLVLSQSVKKDGKICFKGKVVIVFYDIKNKIKKEVPEIIKNNAYKYLVEEEDAEAQRD